MLHGVTLFCIILSYIMVGAVIDSFSNSGISLNLFLWTYLLSFFITTATIAEIDALGRFQNYKQIKDLLHKYGFEKRLLKPFMYSRCQRAAILVAANDIGFTKDVKTFMFNLGYRWYHILPDAFMKQPLNLFKWQFWKSILFTKYYQQRYFYW